MDKKCKTGLDGRGRKRFDQIANGNFENAVVFLKNKFGEKYEMPQKARER